MRLIDADELIEHAWRDKLDSRELIAGMIAKAPTIKEIPTKIPIDIFEKLVSQEPEWIPVSEKLPKKNKWYSCTVVLSNYPDLHYATMDLYFKNGKWLDNRRIDMFNCYEIYGFGKSTEKHKLDYSELLEDYDWIEKVIAWMPLSEPYKIESEDKTK